MTKELGYEHGATINTIKRSLCTFPDQISQHLGHVQKSDGKFLDCRRN